MYRIRAEPLAEDGQLHASSQIKMSTLTAERQEESPGDGPTATPPNQSECPYRWIDAQTAVDLIDRRRARGNRSALWLRSQMESRLYSTGLIIHKNAIKVLLFGLFVLITLSVGLKSATVMTDVERLWVEQDGRLERETAYVKETLGVGHGSTAEIFIQTPKGQRSSSNVLVHKDLLIHLEALKIATSQTVEMFDATWSLRDICYKPAPPSFEEHHIDSMIDNLFPCSIITPLDCFWEGSRLLGPEYPIHIPHFGLAIKWTNFDPSYFIQTMSRADEIGADPIAAGERPSKTAGTLRSLEQFMNRAGITTGYMRRPCLDPTDPECPVGAPNRENRTLVDLGATLTGGCYGFATKHMHWPEELILGGVTRNASGHIVKAKAIQSIIQLIGEHNLHALYLGDYKVYNIDWTPEKAKMILDAWQRKANNAIKRFTELHRHGKQVNIYPFTEASLDGIMKTFSKVNETKVTAWYVLLLVYSCVVLVRWRDRGRSQESVALSGTLFTLLSTSGGLGACSMLGLSFSALSTQVLPYLVLGMGSHILYQLAAALDTHSARHIPGADKTASALRDVGPTLLVSSLATLATYVVALLVPIPALRGFVIQLIIVSHLQLLSMVTLVPAVASLDSKRRAVFSHSTSRGHKTTDAFCSISGAENMTASHVERVVAFKKAGIALYDKPPRPGSRESVDRMAPVEEEAVERRTPAGKLNDLSTSSAAKRLSSGSVDENVDLILDGKTLEKQQSQKADVDKEAKGSGPSKVKKVPRSGMDRLLHSLSQYHIKVTIVAVFLLTLVLAGVGVSSISNGLDFVDVVPRGTNEYKFLDTQRKYFQFYNIYAATMGGFEYPTNQKLLEEYHASFATVSRLIRNDNGGLPTFWLPMFRRWLMDLEEEYHRNRADGRITDDGWETNGRGNVNASDEAILAYKMLVQTGRKDVPVDKTLISSKEGYLVRDGIINPRAFYNYLTAWVNMDPLAYATSQADIRPEVTRWIHVASEEVLTIPKSKPILYAQMAFQLTRVESTAAMVESVQEIRDICSRFETERSLPNFPRGHPFTFWEQYTHLRTTLAIGLVAALVSIFVLTCLVLLNWRAALILTGIVAVTTFQQAGALGWLAVKFSAVPAVMLILSCGISLWYYTHMITCYLCVSGTSSERMASAVSGAIPPIRRGLFASLISLLFIYMTPFDFIHGNFCLTFLALVGIAAFNAILVLPILLALFGPEPDLQPLDGWDHVSLPPSPPPSPIMSDHAHPQPHLYSTARHHPHAHYYNQPQYRIPTSYMNPPPLISGPHSHYQIPVQYSMPATAAASTKSSQKSSQKASRMSRVKSASLSTISEKSTDMGSTPVGMLHHSQQPVAPPPQHYIEPQLVLETTTYTNSTPVPVPGNSVSANTTPIPGSVQELNELNGNGAEGGNSPLNRDSPASLMSESSNGAASLSRASSAHGGHLTHQVTTKATATLKLPYPPYMPPYYHPHAHQPQHPHAHPPPPTHRHPSGGYHDLRTQAPYATTLNLSSQKKH